MSLKERVQAAVARGKAVHQKREAEKRAAREAEKRAEEVRMDLWVEENLPSLAEIAAGAGDECVVIYDRGTAMACIRAGFIVHAYDTYWKVTV